MKKASIYILLLIIVVLTILFGANQQPTTEKIVVPQPGAVKHFWEVRSIDTMKFSRDLAREKLGDSEFDGVIEMQIRNISKTGATHVAIGTPYDEEFLPFLERWVGKAREHGLSMWFRGNWSGWEEWFEYPKIDRWEHLEKTARFIRDNNDIFEDGDIFSACPECENGGPGDPRFTGDVDGYRNFLSELYSTTQTAFEAINKDVTVNYFSMNGDVAYLVMDEATTAALGGVVTIDHYVAEPDELARDIEKIMKQSGGKVVLGEFGAPIPDIHGSFSGDEQGEWVREVLERLSELEGEMIGINYWLSVGGTSELWNENGAAKPVVETISSYFEPEVAVGVVVDESGLPIENATVIYGKETVLSDENGFFEIRYVKGVDSTFLVSAESYFDKEISPDFFEHSQVINLIKVKEKWKFNLF